MLVIARSCDGSSLRHPHNFHLLRHTYATVCIENGFDAKTVSELLGHSNVNITLNRYVHSSLDTKKKYVEKLNFVA
ncbi:MAG: tyrosine-type recombinase/integrase [Ruminococcus bicirculans (ex Wegman et al. 2014)]